jgi:plastocyanin
MFRVRTLLSAILMATVAAVPVWATNHTVTLQNFSFSPSNLTVQRGDSVTWHCVSGTHNVHETSNPTVFTSGSPRAATWDYTFVFDVSAATYHYQCDPHAPGMSGNIIVQEPASGVDDRGLPTATEFALGQNYPNPFNPTTVLPYELKSAGLVQLSVYNVLGEKVADLVNEQQAAGSHSVNFDASALSTGLYIYRLTSGNRTQSAKMLLMK